MVDNLIEHPDVKNYYINYQVGETVFYEGDDSKDLYILVSGKLDVLKGKRKIAEISGRGTLFGEMSYLLNQSRTATIKAKTDTTLIKIPEDRIEEFFKKFPELGPEITRLLAKRLDEASCILYGLDEFCDQLPDAVILMNREGKILEWNKSAEKLYGRESNEMRYKSPEEIYEDPQEYKNFIKEVQSKHSIRERVLKVKHPTKGTRYISTSMTLLYDAHQNLQCMLSLGRDVTSVKNLEKKYRIFKNWFLPFIILAILISVGLFVLYPYMTRGYLPVDLKKEEFRNQIAKDYFMLQSLLYGPVAEKDRGLTTSLIKKFFKIQENDLLGYHGIVLLDNDRSVFNAISKKGNILKHLIGTTYSGIRFKGPEESLHKVLRLYRRDKSNPMGKKAIELAFELKKDNKSAGWIIFQLDMEKIKERYNIDEEDLFKLKIQKP
jgi:PAS domain S-box-containing protein